MCMPPGRGGKKCQLIEQTQRHGNAYANTSARLVPLIAEALPYVQATAEAEHLLDGFGPRKVLPMDELVKRMKEVIG